MAPISIVPEPARMDCCVAALLEISIELPWEKIQACERVFGHTKYTRCTTWTDKGALS